MRLAIQTSTDVPDSTYFTIADVEPDLEDGTLTIYDGYGRHRSWGTPGVSSAVVLHDEDLVAVHVGFHHKHRGGQFWRYYLLKGETWWQVNWRGLDDVLRMRVREAAERTAPAWAKVPGTLRAERTALGVRMHTAYKIVRQMEDGRLLSLYDGTTEYVLGKRLVQRANPGHGGGYYSYVCRQDVMAAYRDGSLWPRSRYRQDMTLALLECEIGGAIVDYGLKMASTYLRPVRVVETFMHTADSQPREVA